MTLQNHTYPYITIHGATQSYITMHSAPALYNHIPHHTALHNHTQCLITIHSTTVGYNHGYWQCCDWSNIVNGWSDWYGRGSPCHTKQMWQVTGMGGGGGIGGGFRVRIPLVCLSSLLPGLGSSLLSLAVSWPSSATCCGWLPHLATSLCWCLRIPYHACRCLCTTTGGNLGVFCWRAVHHWKCSWESGYLPFSAHAWVSAVE